MKTKIGVQLDVSRATAQLKKLTAQGAKAGLRSGQNVVRSFTQAAYGSTVGAGVATARSALTAPTGAGVSDIVSESVGQFGNQVKEWIFGDLDEKAAATRYAREQVIDAFSYQVGQTRQVTPEMRSFFQQVKAQREVSERGRQIIERDSDFRLDVDDIIDRLGKKFNEAADALGEYLWNKLTGG